jgi:hypothetical protein
MLITSARCGVQEEEEDNAEEQEEEADSDGAAGERDGEAGQFNESTEEDEDEEGDRGTGGRGEREEPEEVDSSSRPEEWEEVGCQYSYVVLHLLNTSIIVTGIIDIHLFINCIDYCLHTVCLLTFSVIADRYQKSSTFICWAQNAKNTVSNKYVVVNVVDTAIC